MGVKLQEIIIRKQVDIRDLAGKVVAVDAPNIIMSLFTFSFKPTTHAYNQILIDKTQRPIAHLFGLLYRINFFYSRHIFPIFCFDGRDSELKRVITKDQLNDFRFTERLYKEAMQREDLNGGRRIALSREYMWHNIILESKQLLGALGVPYIESPASAESQCAFLVRQKIAHFSNSQDFDSLLFGCPNVLQNLSKSLRRKIQGKWIYQEIIPYKIDLQKNLENLGITIFQLVDIGLLVGTDYFSGVHGIGPKKALSLIRKHRTIEQVIQKEHQKKYDFSQVTPEIIKKVRKIFLFPEVHENINEIKWNVPDKSQTYTLLCEEHTLDQKRALDNLEKLERNYDRCREFFKYLNTIPQSHQTTLDHLL
jgi:flap endonuclease-1